MAWQFSQQQAKTHLRRVGLANFNSITWNDCPVAHFGHVLHGVFKRGGIVGVVGGYYAVSAGQGVVRQIKRVSGTDHFFVYPVPTRAHQLKIDRELQRQAAVNGFA